MRLREWCLGNICNTPESCEVNNRLERFLPSCSICGIHLRTFPDLFYPGIESQRFAERGITMIVKEYCDRMEKQLAAWRANVEKLLIIAENLQGKDREADERQRKNLQSLIADIGKVSEHLKYECLPA